MAPFFPLSNGDSLPPLTLLELLFSCKMNSQLLTFQVRNAKLVTEKSTKLCSSLCSFYSEVYSSCQPGYDGGPIPGEMSTEVTLGCNLGDSRALDMHGQSQWVGFLELKTHYLVRADFWKHLLVHPCPQMPLPFLCWLPLPLSVLRPWSTVTHNSFKHASGSFNLTICTLEHS